MPGNYGQSFRKIPANHSRGKILSVLNGDQAIPHTSDTAHLYRLFMKIGASNELPGETDMLASFLNDFWRTMYLRNNLCPGDIPFSIIIDEFTIALVQGVVERKGNNQAAICQAFNAWIVRADVRNRLYSIRNHMYPRQKQIPERATPGTVRDYSDCELQTKLAQIKTMAGIKLADMMIAELESEIKRRETKNKNRKQ